MRREKNPYIFFLAYATLFLDMTSIAYALDISDANKKNLESQETVEGESFQENQENWDREQRLDKVTHPT